MMKCVQCGVDIVAKRPTKMYCTKCLRKRCVKMKHDWYFANKDYVANRQRIINIEVVKYRNERLKQLPPEELLKYIGYLK